MMADDSSGYACPIPTSDYQQILLAHGGGGRLTHSLLEGLFLPIFGSPELASRHDGAVVDISHNRLVMTTDAYVVHPLVFPGGDIGTLAINGTVNDLAMCGARPLYLSAAFIIEEGFPVASLETIVRSMRRAADDAQVRVITGDTKVVDRGHGHGLFITTAGIGVIEHDLVISPAAVAPGDVILLSGDVGRHGIAIMAAREGLAFETTIESDCCPLSDPVLRMLEAGIDIHCLRDLTRGGLATSLVEIAETSRLRIAIDESAIPVRDDVRGACEILGFEPIYIANEGRFVAFVPERQADQALALLRRSPVSADACRIGRVTAAASGLVTMKSLIGSERIVDMLSGEQLPRIC